MTESVRGALTTCLVIISVFVILFTIVGISTKSYSLTVLVDGIYLLALWGYVLLLTGKGHSETLKRFMLLFSIVGAVISVYLLYAVLSFGL